MISSRVYSRIENDCHRRSLVNEELDLGKIIFQYGNSLLVDCKLVGLSENAQRSTPNFQRSIQKALHSDLDRSSSYARRFCTVYISGLDVQRWTLDVGRLLLLRHEIQI